MSTTCCPSCGSKAVYPGRLVSPGEFNPAWWFVPHFNQKLVGVQVGFIACSACGHVWSRVAPGELRVSIDLHGRELAKQYLKATNAGPYHDLPDDPEAKRAGDAVALFDFLILTGTGVDAKRRYHELTGRTWDQTHKDIDGWADMTRARKLALFGWRSKDEILAEKAELRDHPMRDRDLDG
jgi:hypothetical protein